MLTLLLACDPENPVDSAAPVVVEFSHERPALDESYADGRVARRAIIHLHSPLSHDACDSQEMDLQLCLADFRSGLCNAAIDVAFVTDHPSMAAEHPYEELFNLQDGDEMIDGVASRITCPSGFQVTLLPGIEDELMPVALDRHVADSTEENDRIYNEYNEETVLAEIAAGGVVLQAHTEGQTLEDLLDRQAWGQSGVEIFNLHAMVDPNKREDNLGLDGMGYLLSAGPFIANETAAEPDLVFLAFYEEQTVSLERWDALNAEAPSLGTGGTDAHENSLPMLMSDGERVDSYRRMVSWFSNYLVVPDDSPSAYENALRERQTFLVFDALGFPTGFDVRYGSESFSATNVAVGDSLVVTCPTLAATSPRDGDDPSITVSVYRNGEIWQDECGTFPVTDPGVYRVRVNIVPHHLVGYLDNQAESLVHDYPWIYSQAFRIGI